MKKIFINLLFSIPLTLLFFTSTAQDKGDFKNAIKSALHIHDTASTYLGSLEATKVLEKAANQFEDEWLANYWAAYIHTQLSLYQDRPRNAGEFIPVNAQKQIDIAKARYKGDSSEILSDLHALQSFVYYVYTWWPQHDDKKDEYLQKYQDETRLALKHNPDNPLIYVLLGTYLLRSDKLSEIVAGRALLYQANAIFKKSNAASRAQTTQWNEEWLRFFWLDNADNLLSKALNN